MNLHVCTDVFLLEKDLKPDLYILIDGKIHIRNKAKEEFLIEPYEIFGFTSIFNKKHWIPARVTARETATIVSIPRGQLKKLMKNVFLAQENTRLIDFLTQTVPGAKKLGQAGKERIASFFEKFYFKAGDILLKEGKLCECAFIIFEGECKLISFKSPAYKELSVYQGLMSNTTNCFNLGVATVGEWVGDDSIMLNKPIDFSVIAANNVTALSITKTNFLENLARETQNSLKETMEYKQKWRKERKRKISQTIMNNILTKEKPDSLEIEKNKKIFSVASKSAIRKIRKRERAKIDKSKTNENSPGYQRKFNDYKTSEQPKRPLSSFSSYNQSRFEGQSIANNVKNNKPNEKNVKLYSASTLGYSVIPVISVKLPKKPGSSNPSQKNIKGFISFRNDKETKSFAEKVRKGRPSSPNPAEVWARQHNVKLFG